MKKVFITIAKGKRSCNCGCNQKINKGEKIIAFTDKHICRGNLKLECAKKLSTQ